MNIGYGQYFLVNFNPCSGHEYQGKRPAIVIESDKQLRKNNLVTVLPLTSNLDNKVGDDILVTADRSNRLKFDSIIKVFDIASFDRSRFINKIGKAKEIKRYLSKHFDLA